MRSFKLKQSLTIAIRLLLVFAFLFVFQSQSNAQNDSLRQHYLKMSKSQNSGAWVMFGAGITCIIVGVIVAEPVETSLRASLGQEVNTKKGTGAFIAGAVFIAGSIPLFIASGKNKRKAASISVS